MPTPRCVYPSDTRKDGMCNKTEAQHGPATGHTFTLEHVPEPDAGHAAQQEHDRAAQPAGEEDAQVYRPHAFANMPTPEPRPLDGNMLEGDPLEGTLLSSTPADPTVTFRAEAPDGLLVEVVIAHPHHDHVTMGRHALVAAEYVLTRLHPDAEDGTP